MQLRLIWLLLFSVIFSMPIEHATARPDCRADLEGITYCVEDRGETHVLIVDLTDPRIRVQTAMANDILDVRPPEAQRERVSDFAQRYRDQGLVIAVNGDYFGAGRGPDGPTVVQGQRLDTPDTIAVNPSHYRRATLTLGRSGPAAITHLDPGEFPAPFVYRDLMFNAISGGPVILFNGQPLPEALPCFLDRIPVNTCRTRRQTAAGIDESGKTLYLAVSTQRSTSEMAQLLRDLGAFNALKLDAGGSSQLWYHGGMLLDSDRGVANALLVFVEGRPRHAAVWNARPAVLLLQTNERGQFEIDLHNTGYLDWTVDRYYGLRLNDGASLASQDFVGLSHDTLPGEVSTVTLQINGASWPGIYESTWQMTTPFERFGPQIPLRVIVIPQQADELRAKIQAELDRVANFNSQGFEREWLSLAEKIRKMIDVWETENPAACEVCLRKSSR